MARWVGSMVAGATVAVSVLVGVPGSAGGAEPPDTTTPESCPTPYAPIAYAQTYPAQEALPAVDGTDIAVRWEWEPNVDTDGDQVFDTVRPAGIGTADALVTFTRGDGDMVLRAPNATDIGTARAGDIDGDGRDEATILVSGGDAPGTYLVPGTTPIGSNLVDAAAIRLTPDILGVAALADSSDRLLLFDLSFVPPGSTTIYDAGDVLALGPGGDATNAEPEATYDGRPQATTVPSATGAPMSTLVLGWSQYDGDTGTGEVRLTVVEPDGDVHELTTNPRPYASDHSGIGDVEVVVGGDGTFVILGQASRSGAAAYMWWLNDPCGELPDAEVDPEDDDPPLAPPAQPVTAPADFTG